jgi:hypothetical protein
MRPRFGWIFVMAMLLPLASVADAVAVRVTPLPTTESGTALAPAVAQCINENAAKVEAAVQDLNQAVDFLVSDVCAEPLAAQAAEQGKRNAERMAAQWKKMCDEETAEQKKSAADYCAMMKVGFLTEPNDDASAYAIVGVGAWNRPAAAVALASRKLLELRLSHMPAKGAK